MAELTLDHVQWSSLTGHLDGMGVTKLVRSEAASDASFESEAPQLGPCRWAGPGPPTGRTVDQAEQRSDRHLTAITIQGRSCSPAGAPREGGVSPPLPLSVYAVRSMPPGYPVRSSRAR
jgi:hypothetical protein